MRAIFVLFLLIILAILSAGHYFIYFSLLRFFNISDPKIKYWLLIILVVLAISFILASILTRAAENLITRTFYYTAALWLGLLLYLTIAFSLVWLIHGLTKAAGINFSLNGLALLAVSLALAITAYGLGNAQKVVIKNIEIPLAGLPENWRDKTVVQISDTHLGPIHGAKFIEKIIGRINSLGPAAVFITGDYFDGVDGRLDNLAEPLNQINAPYGVYYITGNHETYLGTAEALAALGKTKVKIMNDEIAELDGLTLVGISYPEAMQRKDVAGVIKTLNPGRPNILLYHEPTQIKNISQAGIDLMLSGHTHNGQVWPTGYISRLVYKKYVTGLHRLNDFFVYTSVGTGTWGPPLRVGNQPEIVAIKLK